ncbi:Forkhead-associated:Protein kinase [Anaerovibrio sp. JC8]|uniref:serine/threonine-protein kinase n=1 Tax=Anaerovibrio sp. JC8 TaxID=1240085 RepID=UPI000A0E19BE|nr:serine/threonine-protein kinase [Anaerovibrio sp. JC8]ORU00035.1 Forkhead-associated:Protein kinase [Anaerovibrio sp. JC8]
MGTEQNKDAVQLAEEYISSKYEKVRLLHRTDKAEVWLAADSYGNFVVIKKIRLANLPYLTLKNMEKSIWPEIIYCAEDDQSTVVVEEFINGDSFDELLANKQYLTEYTARELLLQLCDGLALLHKQGIIHRDIKPSNIIVQNIGGQEFLRLIDFDAARTVKEEQKEDTRLLGTKGYAPPEQYGYGQTDQRSDIYSLGITFQEMLGENYHGWLAPILNKCVAVDVKQRYQSVNDLKNALIYHNQHKVLKFFGAILAVLLVVGGLWTYRQHVHQERVIPPAVEEIIQEGKEQLKAPILDEKKDKIPAAQQGTKAENQQPEHKITDDTTKAPIANTNQNVEEKTGNAVYAKYYMNGERLGEWTDNFDIPINNWGTTYDFPPDLWKNWSENYPAGWKVRVTVENKSNKTWEDPYLSVWTSDGVGGESRDYFGKTLSPGESDVFVVPLSDFKLPVLYKERRRQEMHFSIHASGNQVLFGEKTEILFLLKNK